MRPAQVPEVRMIGPDGDSASGRPSEPAPPRNSSPLSPNVPLPNPLLLMQQGANQGGLSRFFSPEMLAAAQSGHAPTMPPLPTTAGGGQRALTLEELERQASVVRM